MFLSIFLEFNVHCARVRIALALYEIMIFMATREAGYIRWHRATRISEGKYGMIHGPFGRNRRAVTV